MVVATLLVVACSSEDRPTIETSTVASSSQASLAPAASSTTVTDPPAQNPSGQAAPNGRRRPAPPRSAIEAARSIETTERALRDSATNPSELPDLGHENQVAYRAAAAHPGWHRRIRNRLPDDLESTFDTHMAIRTSLTTLHTVLPSNVPPWQIIEPEPIDALRSYYAEAETATGVEWVYLAAINLVETGMGRIDGLSSAGAQGPMQFIPTTWDEVGDGDVNDPHDAIQAAARYLVRRGGPQYMDDALWGYNNSDHYVAAIQGYASLMRDDPNAFTVLYNWEIYFSTPEGTLWLPVGMVNPETTSVTDFLLENPWSAPV